MVPAMQLDSSTTYAGDATGSDPSYRQLLSSSPLSAHIRRLITNDAPSVPPD